MSRRQAKKVLRDVWVSRGTAMEAQRVLWRARMQNKNGPNAYVNGRWGRWDYLFPTVGGSWF